ncbi:hypothetical protein MA16_Dca006820 [Dendrobium catenatum]|uniref:Uncharacterized protein n=1 Tax=Dendrobium catenatum TaxID=906689 RepID=A0A2I0VSV4_9ASPA|nr:hypothetical protein MA16_Dca006820 [Dendrobium catenatum]
MEHSDGAISNVRRHADSAKSHAILIINHVKLASVAAKPTLQCQGASSFHTTAAPPCQVPWLLNLSIYLL